MPLFFRFFRCCILVFLVFAISACATQHGPISDSFRSKLMSAAPIIQKCESVEKVYRDLSLAPAEVVAGVSEHTKEVWTLKGCADGKRKRAELQYEGNKNGILAFSEY